MARLITLGEDGPLGPSGTQVWVDDEVAEEKPKAPRKAAPKKQEASR